MEDTLLAVSLIDSYANLQRIKAAQDREREIAYQIQAVKAKLEVLGIEARNLDLS